MTTKIEKVRRRLRKILPEWMKQEGRAPNREEFLAQYKMREELSHPQYSTAKAQVMEELGYAGDNNTTAKVVKSVVEANAAAEAGINKRLEQAAKHLLSVMEKDGLEEVTVVYVHGEAHLEFQAAPPPRRKVELS